MSLLVQIGTIATISLWGMILDYLSPKLEWTDTKNLYSKNFKPLLVMLICLVIGGFNIGLIVTKKSNNSIFNRHKYSVNSKLNFI